MTDIPPTYSETRHDEVVAGEPGAVPARGAAGTGVVSTRSVAAFSGSPGYRAVQAVWLVLAVVELIIGLRVVFKAIGANAQNGFVDFIYTIGAPLVAPFEGIVHDRVLGSSSGILEIGSIIAMAVYLVAAAIVAKAIRIAATPRAPVAAA